VLQLRSTYCGAITRWMAKIQTICQTRRSRVRVVDQEKGKAQTNPGVPSRQRKALGRMSGGNHLDSLMTIVGLCGAVKGMPEGRCKVPKGGDGDRSQGCTGPRGRTLGEDQARSVSQAGVTSE
jgi:hypothetical protein